MARSNTKRRTNRHRSWGQNALGFIGATAPYVYRAARTFRSMAGSGSGARTRSSAPRPVTTQFDSRTVYRKRRMPYRKKRRWIRQKRSVNAVLNKRLATNVHMLRFNGTTTNAVGQQNYIGFALFDTEQRSSLSEAVDRLQPDLPDLMTVIPPKVKKYVVVGSMMNAILRNTSESGVAYVDVYYWRAKRDVPAAEFVSLNSIWSQGFGYNVVNTGLAPDSALVHTDPGVTPWANPAMRKFVEIYKKTRIRLGSGQDTELSIRSPKNWYNNGEFFHDQKSLIRGVTNGVLIVFRGGPSATSQSESQTLRWTFERTAYYKVLENSVRTAGETGHIN